MVYKLFLTNIRRTKLYLSNSFKRAQKESGARELRKRTGETFRTKFLIYAFPQSTMRITGNGSTTHRRKKGQSHAAFWLLFKNATLEFCKYMYDFLLHSKAKTQL